MDESFAGKARRLALTLVTFILSLSVHEFAHAWMGHRLGDTTAKKAGRLSLNPAVHVDPIGTLLLPTMSVLLGGIGFIGWAKPVPFDSSKFRKGVNRRFGSALVAAAGPTSNFLIAVFCVGVVGVLIRVAPGLFEGEFPPAVVLLINMIQVNVGLAVFNLLPFPPLDGHWLLPPFLDPIVGPLRRYGIGILFLAFLVFPSLGQTLIGGPVAWLVRTMFRLVGPR